MHHPIGREENVERIVTTLLDGGSILLVGEAGVGKSHLAAAVGDALGAREWSHEWIHAVPATRSVHLGALQHVIGNVTQPSPEASATAAEQRLRAARQAVLIIDDIDHLDDASAALIHRVASSGVAVLATVRSEAAADPNVLALWKDEVMERIEVGAVGVEHTAALAESFLGGPLSPADVASVAALTMGNPLFIRELLADARTVGELAEAEGVWSFATPPSPHDRISDLLIGRFEHLTPEDREALELVAVGEPLPVTALQRVTSVTQLELLERDGLISLSTIGDVEVVGTSHPLIGEVVRGSSSELGQRRRTQLLADAILADGSPRPADVVRAVNWIIDAGGAPPAHAASDAASAALGTFDGDAAAQFIDASGRSDSPALVMLGRAHLLRQDAPEAVAALTRAVESSTTDTDRSVASIALAEVLLFAVGDTAGAQQVLTDALASVTGPNARAVIAGVVMLAAGLGGDFQPSLHLGRSLLIERTLDDHSRLSLLRMTTLAQTVTGEIDGLEADLDTGLAIALRAIDTDPVTYGLLQITRWISSLDRIGLDGTRRLILRHLEVPGRPRGLHCLPSTMLSVIDVFCGDGAAAARHSARALEDPSSAVVGMSSLLQAQTAWTHSWCGDDEMAMAMHDTSLGNPRNGPRERAYLGLARASVLANSGDLDAAVEECRRGAAESGDLRLWAIWFLHSAVRFGRAGAVRATLDEETNFFDTAFTGVMIEHARVLDDADPLGLVKVAGQFHEQGVWLLAAEALAQASSITDDADGSAQLAQRAWVLFDRCNRVRSIAMNGIERPLSEREDEVAWLAATGLTSREIADRLFVSQRTVDNHLHSVYRKLGIGQRVDLTPLFA